MVSSVEKTAWAWRWLKRWIILRATSTWQADQQGCMSKNQSKTTPQNKTNPNPKPKIPQTKQQPPPKRTPDVRTPRGCCFKPTTIPGGGLEPRARVTHKAPGPEHAQNPPQTRTHTHTTPPRKSLLRHTHIPGPLPLWPPPRGSSTSASAPPLCMAGVWVWVSPAEPFGAAFRGLPLRENGPSPQKVKRKIKKKKKKP